MAQEPLTDGMHRQAFREAIDDNFTEVYTSIEAISTVSISTDTTLDATAFGKLHLCSGTSADYTIDLPTAVGNTGKTIGFKGIDALTKVVTLDANTTQTIDGDLTLKMSSSGVVVLFSDGTNWVVTQEVGSWIPFTPTETGFSALGTVGASYFKQGKLCTYRFTTTATGTSNATTYTITAPFTAKNISIWVILVTNAGTTQNGRIQTAASSNVLTLFATAAGGAFTNSGLKNSQFIITYEIE